MISVCIATYNGEKFIQKQLDSIVNQLSPEDEVIIVDDCSKDNTISLIQQNYSKQVKIFSNEENLGFVKSFEKAIYLANGDYIYLSDQDDVWLENKIIETLPYLEKGNDLVIHDAFVVDKNMEVLQESCYLETGSDEEQSVLGNIYGNIYPGCMMAFSRRLKEAFMPVPDKFEVHDQWIFLVAKIKKFKIKILKKPLMLYVRHGDNATGIKKRKLTQVLCGRYITIVETIKYHFKR